MRALIEETEKTFVPTTDNSVALDNMLNSDFEHRLNSVLRFVRTEADPFLDKVQERLKGVEFTPLPAGEDQGRLPANLASPEFYAKQMELALKTPDDVAELKAKQEYEQSLTVHLANKEYLKQQFYKAERNIQIAAPRAFSALAEIPTTNELSSLMIERVRVSVRKKLVGEFKAASSAYKDISEKKEPTLLTPQQWREKEAERMSYLKTIAQTRKDFALK